jgi:hypothetical protein
MADDFDLVTIQYGPTKETLEVFRSALPGFPGWDVLKSDGSVNPNPAAAPSTSNKKD